MFPKESEFLVFLSELSRKGRQDIGNGNDQTLDMPRDDMSKKKSGL